MWQCLQIIIKFYFFHILISNLYSEPILSSEIVWDTLSENAKFKYKQLTFHFYSAREIAKCQKNASCYSSSKNRNEIIRSQLMAPFSEEEKRWMPLECLLSLKFFRPGFQVWVWCRLLWQLKLQKMSPLLLWSFSAKRSFWAS